MFDLIQTLIWISLLKNKKQEYIYHVVRCVVSLLVLVFDTLEQLMSDEMD